VSHPLVERLECGDAPARRAAAGAIARDPAAALLLEPLARALDDADPGVRRAAGDALVALGRSEREVDRLLLGALRGERAESRFEAARAMAELAPPSPKLVPALVEALSAPRRETAWEAARILVDAGRLHAEVAPLLTGLVRAGPDAAARAMAVACLRELAPERPESAAALLDASRDPDVGVRRAAFTALPALAPFAEPGPIAARCREAAGDDPDASVRSLAERARELIEARG
jgi:HEAT repeat protein